MMKFFKNTPKTKEQLHQQSFDFETSIHYLIEQSNKRMWLIAGVSGLIAILSIIAVLLLTPLKEVEPYVIRVDNTTGAVDIISVLNEEQITENEALDKHFIAQYVKSREGYFYDMLNNDYTLVQLFSIPSVAESYRALYQGDKARDVVFKNFVQVSVDILSITLADSNGTKTATIRTNLRTKNRNSGEENVSYKVVTLSYEYQIGKIDERHRLLNPLGFKVLTYRTDEEIRR